MKFGVAQLSIGDKIEYNLAKVYRYMERAAGEGICLLGFPEMFLTGYNPSYVGNGDLNAKVDEALGGIGMKSKELGVGAIVGHGYRHGGKFINRASVILPDGRKFSYDKIHLTEVEEKYFVPGSESLYFEFAGHRIGVIICRDQNDPMLIRHLREQGVDILYIISAHYYKLQEARWKVDKNRAIPIARAVENKIYVFLANAVGSHIGMVSLGNSLIVDPEGCVVVSAGEIEECLLTTPVGEAY
ncbi:carbon-nitrogen hydrolase family protein [Caldanaerobius polysaccharolyticus]|uniref:carbon-nitrogen hydrolase family protein n=1 Tax=Caldanaerobius polysaccharolyticus TaxID=44256 RepID=UPI00047EB043|nr:carbon-nitrogen hydrolase family protein [Caldanaerobius polysaccharolyticus]